MNSAPPALLGIPEYDYWVEWHRVNTHARKHHNNKGLRQIKRGKTREQVRRIAKNLNIPYVVSL